MTSRPTVSMPGLDAELRDARAHRAQPDDSDLPHLSHGARCYLRVSGGTTRPTTACVYQSLAHAFPHHDAVEPALVSISHKLALATAERAASNCSSLRRM